ncbi:DUF433 domain-containing protein [uncultured Enterovirga sp.]|uniref:DUF433 domain-containing protein n=1 Tax=uncultured Enterovirga sp. TaxID=2026352 RepID=UPI0035CCA1C1
MRRSVQGFPTITVDPAVMGGKPSIRGMRVTVGMILDEIGAGTTVDQLLADFPYIQRDDVSDAIRFGAWLARFRDIDLVEAGGGS